MMLDAILIIRKGINSINSCLTKRVGGAKYKAKYSPSRENRKLLEKAINVINYRQILVSIKEDFSFFSSQLIFDDRFPSKK